jgi:hypothetical protein
MNITDVSFMISIRVVESSPATKVTFALGGSTYKKAASKFIKITISRGC